MGIAAPLHLLCRNNVLGWDDRRWSTQFDENNRLRTGGGHGMFRYGLGFVV